MSARLGALKGRPAAQVTGRDIQAWVSAQATDLAPSSLRQYLGELKRVFDWGEVYPNPCRWPHLRLPRVSSGQGQPDPPSLSEFWRLLAALPLSYRDPLIVAEGTGVRISELRRLDLGDLDRRHARLRVARSKTDAGVRFVPLLPQVSRAIERHRHERRAGPVFPGLSDNGFRLAIARSAQRVGLRHFTPHDMRDRFISLMNLAGIPLPLIRQIAGHTKNTVTLDIYTGVILDEPEWRLLELRRAIGQMTGFVAQSGGAAVGPPSAESDENPADSRKNRPDGGYRDPMGLGSWARRSAARRVSCRRHLTRARKLSVTRR